MLRKLNVESILLLIAVGYPFLMHYWLINENFIVASFYIISAVTLLSVQNFIHGHKGFGFGLLGVVIIICTFLLYEEKLVIYFPPIVMPLVIAYIFSKTLLGEQDAFITAIAKKIRQSALAAEEIKYTRNLTYAWIGFLLFIAIEAAITAFIVDLKTWSYITNFINYIFVAIFAIVEYFLRHIVLSHLDHLGFIEFIKKLIHVQMDKK